MRHDNRQIDELRPLSIQRPFVGAAPGSLLISAGNTSIICTASIDESVPRWKQNMENPTGWVTAEYNMLPGSTSPRKARRADGRSTEIQRLIGRSLRAAVDFEALGERTITIDCDVVKADGGTRTLAITGGFMALVDALATVDELKNSERPVLKQSVAAISVGIVDGVAVLDLDYPEDSTAGADMNIVMAGDGQFIEVQGTAETGTFGRDMLNDLLDLAEKGTRELTAFQKETLGDNWDFAL